MMRYYYNRVINHHDSLVYVLYKNNVSLAERDFFINESETLSAKTSELKRNVITIILSFVFVIICIGVYLYLNKKRKNAEYDALIAESQNAFFQISQLESQLKDAANNLDLQKAHFNKLFKNRFKEIDTLSSIYYKRKENGENVDEVINNLKTILSSIVDEENLIELQEIINRYNNNIIARFKNQFPNLKNTYIVFFTLILSGMSAKTISLVTSIQLGNYYNRRTRLIAKISESNAPDKDEFLKILKSPSD